MDNFLCIKKQGLFPLIKALASRHPPFRPRWRSTHSPSPECWSPLLHPRVPSGVYHGIPVAQAVLRPWESNFGSWTHAMNTDRTPLTRACWEAGAATALPRTVPRQDGLSVCTRPTRNAWTLVCVPASRAGVLGYWGLRGRKRVCGGGGGGMTFCCVAVCSWRRLLASRHLLLPFP